MQERRGSRQYAQGASSACRPPSESQFPQVSGLHDPVVSARIQHRLFKRNDGFRPARVWFRAWYERTSRRTVSLAAALSEATPKGHIGGTFWR